MPLSRGEREGPAAKRWEGKGVRSHRAGAVTPHPPTPDGVGPSFSLREKDS